METRKQLIAGVDEAGRGALAGPVVAGAVILPDEFPTEMMRDSKTLSPEQRETAYIWITENADWGAGIVSSRVIDEIGIKPANHQAMQEAVAELKNTPGLLRIDGRDHYVFSLPSEEYIRGDSRFAEIAAASIIAKVTRDRIMREAHKKYPEYGFSGNKGYGSAEHLVQIRKTLGSELHRKSYDPLRTLLQQSSLFGD